METNYKTVLEYLKTASLRGSKLGLERITELCERLGNPQNKIKVIHVAGTNGKGSFCAMLSAVLHDAGYTIGNFSSPALTEVVDSFRINGSKISHTDFSEIMSDIIPQCESMNDKPTEFEVLTAAAYQMFVYKKCDIAIVECGMGGDTDSTNVITAPLLSVITNIAVDHTAFLGSTIQEISSHKTGIIKEKCPVLYGGNDTESLEIIRKTAEKKQAPLTITNHSKIKNVCSDIHGTSLDFNNFNEVKTPLTGTYQQYNIANVLTAVEILRQYGLDIPDSCVKSGLKSTKWHGRFELISENPIIIFDGAHNPDGIKQVSASIEKYFKNQKIALLISVMADKDYTLYPELLGKYINHAFTVRADNPRALDSQTLADTFLNRNIPAIAFSNLSDGVKSAVHYATDNNIPLVALGSLYLYKDFIKSLNPHNLHE
ncbi:MAG: bifunctional folylpolyglutamate synthase/dihydrofolate synthase [Ruminococcus sp.]|nr:bifunctional folylpolyglutamate synthase/dihydrofolate synthase [Ruminococcus sp.]